MAFQVREGESIAHGLRRLARKELRRAREALRQSSPPRDEAIHEARKSVKKVRAIFDFIAEDHGRGLTACKKQLRSVNRTLSRLRDADAILEALHALKRRNPHVFSEHTFARVRRLLASRKQAAMDAAARDGVWTTLDRKLRKIRRAAKHWKPKHRGLGALVDGMQAAHRRGRHAMECARRTGHATDFHEWRKQIKALWYALRLIERAGPAIRRDVAALNRAETLLGDEHNLVVLCAELSKNASVCGGAVEIDRLRLAADRWQCAWRKRAGASAQRIYRRRSRQYVRALARAWTIHRQPRRPKRARRRPHVAA